MKRDAATATQAHAGPHKHWASDRRSEPTDRGAYRGANSSRAASRFSPQQNPPRLEASDASNRLHWNPYKPLPPPPPQQAASCPLILAPLLHPHPSHSPPASFSSPPLAAGFGARKMGGKYGKGGAAPCVAAAAADCSSDDSDLEFTDCSSEDPIVEFADSSSEDHDSEFADCTPEDPVVESAFCSSEDAGVEFADGAFEDAGLLIGDRAATTTEVRCSLNSEYLPRSLTLQYCEFDMQFLQCDRSGHNATDGVVFLFTYNLELSAIASGKSSSPAVTAQNSPCGADALKTWKMRAEEEAKLLLEKVAELRAAVMEGRSVGDQFAGQWVVGKGAKLKAAIADRKYFDHSGKYFGALRKAQQSIAAQAIFLIDHPCCNLESVLQNRRIQAKKLSGMFVEPVICDDRCGVPKAALTCNAVLDEANWLLADSYSGITCLLERISMCMVFKFLCEALCDKMDAEIRDLKAATAVFRTMCRKIRAEIGELGGLPLIEPVAFWKEKFPMMIGDAYRQSVHPK
ncbi:hypothetical protein EJB05_26456, partial [Eragrostis curvula]